MHDMRRRQRRAVSAVSSYPDTGIASFATAILLHDVRRRNASAAAPPHAVVYVRGMPTDIQRSEPAEHAHAGPSYASQTLCRLRIEVQIQREYGTALGKRILHQMHGEGQCQGSDIWSRHQATRHAALHDWYPPTDEWVQSGHTRLSVSVSSMQHIVPSTQPADATSG